MMQVMILNPFPSRIDFILEGCYSYWCAWVSWKRNLFIFAGAWLAIGHIVSALACFLTITGIPFGIQHLKLAGLALAPIGKKVVTK